MQKKSYLCKFTLWIGITGTSLGAIHITHL